MVASRIIAGLVAATCVSAAASPVDARSEDAFLATLLKRQEPGTPAYNCHDNCGLAISLSRQAGPCTNTRFVSSYNNCLQCSGPDNFDIWRYYGFTLTNAGTGCGFSTTPLSGKQPDVPPAGSSGPPGGVGSSSSSTPPPATSAPPTSAPPPGTSAPPATSSPAPTTGGPAPTTGSPAPSSNSQSSASTVGFPVSSVLSSVHSSALSATTSKPVVSTPSVSGVPHTSARNGTSSYSTSAPPAQVTRNAASGLEYNAVGFFGAIFMGVMYGM